jgi:hypothetical protein
MQISQRHPPKRIKNTERDHTLTPGLLVILPFNFIIAPLTLSPTLGFLLWWWCTGSSLAMVVEPAVVPVWPWWWWPCGCVVVFLVVVRVPVMGFVLCLVVVFVLLRFRRRDIKPGLEAVVVRVVRAMMIFVLQR